MKKYLRLSLVLAFSFIEIYLIFAFGKQPLFHFSLFASRFINAQINLQLSTILLSLSMVGFLFIVASKTKLKYLNITHINGKMDPVKWLGIPEGSTWIQTGFIIGAMISLGTALVVHFQVNSQSLTFRLFPDVPLVLVLALMNSFTEEIIFRYSYVTIVHNEGFSPNLALFLGSAVFGTVHYFGMAPKGIMGALMAAFLGWFLTKSILETKGFFWAWFIHFLQDVVILMLFFSAL